MLKVGAIRKSVSLWASPVVLVQKKDDSLRFCINLRKLNSRTIKDAYSLPRIEESLDYIHIIRIKSQVLAGGDGREQHSIHSLHHWTTWVL